MQTTLVVINNTNSKNNNIGGEFCNLECARNPWNLVRGDDDDDSDNGRFLGCLSVNFGFSYVQFLPARWRIVLRAELNQRKSESDLQMPFKYIPFEMQFYVYIWRVVEVQVNENRW